MKKMFWLQVIIAALTIVNTDEVSAKCFTPDSNGDSIRVSKDSLVNMTKEEFDAYCDSIYNAEHPWIKEVTYTDTVKMTNPPTRQKRYFEYANNYVPNSVSISTSKAVGQIDIESDTSPTGAKTYTVPIKAYKQDGMFCPDISLVYNSQGGKSAYGKGWSIGGLQSITRGNKTIYYDGKTEGMKMNADDVFYLNGVRLIHTTGHEYQTEEGNIKAVATVTGNVVKCFNVYYPNGYTAVFGSTSETSNRIEYPIMTLTDTRGQNITYYYSSSGDSYFLSSIYYGSGGYISCSYNNAGDDYQYRGGKSLNNNRLLQSITCKINGTNIGTYTFSHTTNNGESLLSQIDYSANGSSLNPLKFYYGDGSAVQGYYIDSGILKNGYSFANRQAMTAVRGRFDYANGNDGILFYPNKNPYYLKKSVLLPFSYLQNYYDPNTEIFLYDNLNEDYPIKLTPSLTAGSGFIQMLTANLDGCGQECFVKVNNVVDNIYDKVTFVSYQTAIIGIVKKDSCTFSYSTVYTDNYGNKSVWPKYYYTGDFNGDGKAEIMAISAADPFETGSGTSMCYIYDLNNNATLYSDSLFNFVKYLEGIERSANNAENLSDKVFPMDYNGDGKTDLCHIHSTGMSIYTFNQNGSTWTDSLAATYTGLTKSSLENVFWSIGDFNGDGQTDLVCSGSMGILGNIYWNFYYSKGDGTFAQATNVEGPCYNDYTSYLVQDVNGDGISDLVELTDEDFTVYTMNKNVLTEEYTQALSNSNEYLSPVSINSSSLSTQFVSLLRNDMTLYSYKTNLRTDQALTGMANSNGVVEKNYYYSISNDNTGIYSPTSEDFLFPYIKIYEPIAVLAGNEIFMGGVSKDVNRYSYQGAVAHLQGLGFRGFRSVTTTNKRGLPTTHTYKPAEYCLPESVVGPGFETFYNYTTTFDPTYNKIRKSLLTSKTEWDLLRNVTATSSYTYGFYSQLLTENTTYPGNISVNKTYNYTHYPNISSKYHLARPDSITTTITRNSIQHSEKTLYKSYNSYDEPRTIVNKVNGNIVKTTDFVYDSYGNITSQSVKPYLSDTARITTYQYDYYNRLAKVTDPLGVWKEYTYNSDGTIASTRTYIGYTYYTYDAFGRQISETKPDTTTVSTSFTWNTGNSGLYAVTKSGTNMPTETTIYDALNREVRQQQTRFDGNQLKVDKLYDTYGNLWKESYPYKTGSPTYMQYTYDANNRLETKSEIGKTTTYSYNGLQTTVNDGTISTTTTTDALGGVVSVTDPAGTINYTLNGAGNPTSISAPASSGSGITTTITYDGYGRRKTITDPSSGITTYDYHSTEGYLKSEENANSQTTNYVYDKYDRIIQKTSPEFSTTYTYNNNLNKITGETSSNGTSTIYNYDTKGRLSSIKENAVDGKWLQKDYTYTSGRVSAIKYTSQNGVLTTENYYYTNGHMTSVKLNGTTTIFTLSGEDGQGRAGYVNTGNLSRYYNYTVSGYPTSRVVTASGQTKQLIQYSFSEQTGNLASRSLPMLNLSETFSYDNLNRLTGFGSHSVTYDNNGNITSKGDVGSFAYNSSGKPYAVSNVTLTNSISVGTQNVSYYSFNRPNEISDNGYTASFTYNGNYDRVKMQMLHNSSASLTRYYLGGCYELDVKPSGTTERLYLNGGYYDAPTVLIKQGNTSSVYQLLRDHLGSITHVLNSSGTVVQELSYDAWGRLRNPSTFALYTPTNEPEPYLGRGYCGHEHLTGLDLINMNTRLYDPLLGRFLSPDPYVQAPEHSQSFNRYSYCMNNPLKYVDEDGEFWWIIVAAAVGGVINITSNSDNIHNLGDALGYFGVGAVAGGVGALTGGAIAGSGILYGALGGLASGASSGMILGGGNAFLQSGNINAIIKSALGGMIIGGLSGAIIGGAIGGLHAYYNGNKIWTGKPIEAPNQWGASTENVNKIIAENNDVSSEHTSSLIDTNTNTNNTSITKYDAPNNGAFGEWKSETLRPGTTIDRYGLESGVYASPKGTPIEMRSLPPSNSGQYNSYLIVKPINVKTSIVAPWYGHWGGGIQYKFPIDFETLQYFKIIIKL
jgi:RHS repeat-associated protein